MSDIPVDSYDPDTSPVRSLCDGSERSERRKATAFSKRRSGYMKAPVHDTGIRGDEGAWRVVEQAMRA